MPLYLLHMARLPWLSLCDFALHLCHELEESGVGRTGLAPPQSRGSRPTGAPPLCRDVNWGFLVILYGAKALVFGVVVLVTAVASYPTNVGRAGLYGIFCTQSNDFALGYPLGKWWPSRGKLHGSYVFGLCEPISGLQPPEL